LFSIVISIENNINLMLFKCWLSLRVSFTIHGDGDGIPKVLFGSIERYKERYFKERKHIFQYLFPPLDQKNSGMERTNWVWGPHKNFPLSNGEKVGRKQQIFCCLYFLLTDIIFYILYIRVFVTFNKKIHLSFLSLSFHFHSYQTTK